MKKQIWKTGILETWRTKQSSVLSGWRANEVWLYISRFVWNKNVEIWKWKSHHFFVAFIIRPNQNTFFSQSLWKKRYKIEGNDHIIAVNLVNALVVNLLRHLYQTSRMVFFRVMLVYWWRCDENHSI